MVRITLSNQAEQSKVKKVTLDLDKGLCFLNKSEGIALSELSALSFEHPLLSHPILSLKEGVYQYVYDDYEGLFATSKWVYATLIHAKEPVECRFKVAPSKNYLRLKKQYKFFLSMDYRKPATELMDVGQLNQVITQLSETPFHYQDTLVIDQSFSFADLPKEVNGDELFYTDSGIEQILFHPEHLAKFEIRYINRYIGFGIFARKKIDKEELLGIYCGMKEIKQPAACAYYFLPHSDNLHMGTDAKNYGNFTRFINHAPTQGKGQTRTANLITSIYKQNGMLTIVFKALRAIEKNEQLFIDYGEQMVEKLSPLLFNERSESLDVHNNVIKETFSQRSSMLRAMFRAGIKSAFFPLYKRVLFTVLLVVFLLLLVNFF